MGPDIVVVDPPGLDAVSGCGKAAKPVEVEALVSEATVEGFHQAVFDRLPWSDESQRHTVLVGPPVEILACAFRSMS